MWLALRKKIVVIGVRHRNPTHNRFDSQNHRRAIIPVLPRVTVKSCQLTTAMLMHVLLGMVGNNRYWRLCTITEQRKIEKGAFTDGPYDYIILDAK